MTVGKIEYKFVCASEYIFKALNTENQKLRTKMIDLEHLSKIVNEFRSENKSSNDECLFKICRDKYIVVMEKREDTITNESRRGVINKDTAKFRANKLRVVLIIDLADGSTTTTKITNVFCDIGWGAEIEYEVGTVAVPDGFNEDLEIVCSHGIHYFRNLERAFLYGKTHHEIPLHITVWKEWTENGSLAVQCGVKNSLVHGQYEAWYENGKLKIKCHYVNGLLHGEQDEWLANGNLYAKRKYENGQETQYMRNWL